MKYYLLNLLLTFSIFTSAQNVYSNPVKSIDGTGLNLSQYAGKKVLIYIVPFSADSSKKLAELTYFMNKYQGKVVVIGVPALETGFVKGDEAKLKKLFQDNNLNVVLTEAMSVKKSSSATQAQLFKWLTDKDSNRHFNQDVGGIGQKFFIDESGNLYGVIGPEMPLTHLFIEKVMSK